jgi:hypothetical protein
VLRSAAPLPLLPGPGQWLRIMCTSGWWPSPKSSAARYKRKQSFKQKRRVAFCADYSLNEATSKPRVKSALVVEKGKGVSSPQIIYLSRLGFFFADVRTFL